MRRAAALLTRLLPFLGLAYALYYLAVHGH